jgi:hypothetical protein
MSKNINSPFNDYISILRRRGLLMVATFVGLLVVAIVVVVVIPPGLPIHGHDPGGIADDSDRPDSLHRGKS